MLFSAPTEWELPTLLVYLACPAALATITVDPHFSTVVFLLAPINSVLYAFGGLACWVLLGEFMTASPKS